MNPKIASCVEAENNYFGENRANVQIQDRHIFQSGFIAGAASRDAEIAELVAALESVEWTRLGEMPEGNHCCYCGALKKHGHVTGCKVANVLKRTTLAQALARVRKPTFFEAGRQSVIEGCDDGTIDWRGENEV